MRLRPLKVKPVAAAEAVAVAVAEIAVVANVAGVASAPAPDSHDGIIRAHSPHFFVGSAPSAVNGVIDTRYGVFAEYFPKQLKNRKIRPNYPLKMSLIKRRLRKSWSRHQRGIT